MDDNRQITEQAETYPYYKDIIHVLYS